MGRFPNIAAAKAKTGAAKGKLYGMYAKEIYQAAKNGGVNFDDFVGSINNKLGDKESKEGIHRIFELFIDDPNADTITLSSLKKIAQELGENMSAEELKDMLERASANGTELTFDEFYEIMTKKSFP